MLGKFFCKLEAGTKPFADMSPASVLEGLRARLKLLGVPNAEKYRTHDFRRGHAKDLLAAGATLYEILAAGEWKPPAFLKYQDLKELHRDVVVEAHMAESSEEEGGNVTSGAPALL